MAQILAPAVAESATDVPPLPSLIVELFAALRLRGARYCHWKSNLRLEQGLRGQTDLDLLVDPAHRPAFAQILAAHGARPVRAAPGREYPGVENYLAFDEGSGKLFHLHVHYRLVLGEQFVKNYSLPLEEQFLASARLRQGVYVPAPELELIVLTLRALLKYRDRDVVKDVLKIRHPGLPAHITDEIAWLLAQTSFERVEACLQELGEAVPGATVLAFLRTVTTAPRDGRTLLALRGQVRRALRPYQRGSRARAALIYVRELWRRRNRFLRFTPVRGMRLTGRGRSLALIGADGAGKSTMCRQLLSWLSWKLDARVYYLGSKAPSRRSRLLYMLFRMARRSHTELSRSLGSANHLCRAVAAVRQGLLYGHCLSIGLDRYGRYMAGSRLARAGSVVIFDRYPLEALSDRTEHRLLDGPQIPLLDGDDGPLHLALAGVERWLYRRMRPPEHLFVLDVSPDVALQRKPDHRREQVQAKSRALRTLKGVVGPHAGAFELVYLSADQPLEEVLAGLKAHIWRVIA